MHLRKYWREFYLTVMVVAAYAIIIASVLFFRNDPGLVVTAAGVFVGVLGVGMYDQWQAAAVRHARVKTRR